MSGAYGSTSGTDERESRPVMEPLMHFELGAEVDRLRAEEAWRDGDRNSRTLAKDVDFRALLTVLRPGATLDEQHGDARASIQLLEGGATLTVADDSIELAKGQLAVIDAGRAWTLEAVSDAAVLLTLAWPLTKSRV